MHPAAHPATSLQPRQTCNQHTRPPRSSPGRRRGSDPPQPTPTPLADLVQVGGSHLPGPAGEVDVVGVVDLGEVVERAGLEGGRKEETWRARASHVIIPQGTHHMLGVCGGGGRDPRGRVLLDAVWMAATPRRSQRPAVMLTTSSCPAAPSCTPAAPEQHPSCTCAARRGPQLGAPAAPRPPASSSSHRCLTSQSSPAPAQPLSPTPQRSPAQPSGKKDLLGVGQGVGAA